MEEPIPTPAPASAPAHIFRAGPLPAKDLVFSSSPAFATPAHPIRPREARPLPAVEKPIFAPQLKPANAQTVLPIILPPQTLRPVAFRTLTKKHNLTITSSGLGALASFVGKFCGERWRQEGLAERVLDEIAKQWKRDNGGLILDDGQDKKLKNILKCLEPCMSGGKLDTARLSRSKSTASPLSRSDNLLSRPNVSRDDSQASLGLSALDVEDQEMEEDDAAQQDPRAYLKVVAAFTQPRLTYSISKKTLELNITSPSLMPPIQQKIAAFRNRYHLVHQRLLRNESFQTTTFSSTTGLATLSRSASNVASMTGSYKITPISNLLGRSGTSHLLLGLLVHSAAGDLSLTDLTGSAVLDISTARPIPDADAWFCPGMIVLLEGSYDDDGSNNSNLGSAGGVGGQIKGRFIVDTIAGPPAERREVTLGTGHNHKIDAIHTVAGAGYGWFDFLGTGSEKALGQRMRRVQRRVLGQEDNSVESEDSKRTKVIMIGECTLDNPRTLEAIKAILNDQLSSGNPSDRPLTVVLLGNFVSAASMAGSEKGGDSIHYKEAFDGLASVLSEFPSLLSSTTFVFVPGDNDPWASSFSAGAATLLPRQGVPELFTSRIRRAINNANNEANLRKDIDTPGEAIFASNPARLSLFGPVEEIALFRDDITSRIRRNAILFPKAEQLDEGMADENDISLIQPDDSDMPDPEIEAATSRVPIAPTTTTNQNVDKATTIGRRLTKLLLDQSHLAPFPTNIRPTLWDFSHSLSLYPLPTALCVCDAEAPAFCVTYEGCHVMNPGRLLEDSRSGDGARRRGGGLARWIEYDVLRRRGNVREMRF